MSTICAPATALGEAAVAIIRLSGSDSLAILKKVFKHKQQEFTPRVMYFGQVMDGHTGIDSAMAVYFNAPKSYTGEDMAEIHCHGGMMAVKVIMDVLLKNGAVPAQPGEFSKRAFVNGKMDVSQAEAIQDTIGALSAYGLRAAQKQVRGALFKRISSLQHELTDIIASLEAGIEYPEEDLEESLLETQLPRLHAVFLNAKALLGSYDQGKLLREGIKVAISGKPNVGKSSLLNAILGEERAIVSSVKGTTRDVIAEYFNLNSLPIKFLDTAGLRDTSDEVEKIGVDKAREVIDEADIVLLLLDSSEALTDEDVNTYRLLKRGKKELITVLNKSDLAPRTAARDIEKAFHEHGGFVIEISAKTKEGISRLLDEIYNKAAMDKGLTEGVIITNSRHKNALLKAVSALEEAIGALKAGIDLDCALIDINIAWQRLGEITGRTLSEDIIDRIFEKFCLGK